MQYVRETRLEKERAFVQRRGRKWLESKLWESPSEHQSWSEEIH
jgi:hypothetical protein